MPGFEFSKSVMRIVAYFTNICRALLVWLLLSRIPIASDAFSFADAVTSTNCLGV